MKAYDCLVRLAGNVHHEVPKFGITVKEIAMLRFIHGEDSVVGIKNNKDPVTRTEDEEMAYLAANYSEEMVKKLFNVSLNSLEVIEIAEPDVAPEEVPVKPPKVKAPKAAPIPEPEIVPEETPVSEPEETTPSLD